MAKRYRERDQLIALERSRNEEIRFHDRIDHNFDRKQPQMCGTEQLEGYCSRSIGSRRLEEEPARNMSNSGYFLVI